MREYEHSPASDGSVSPLLFREIQKLFQFRAHALSIVDGATGVAVVHERKFYFTAFVALSIATATAAAAAIITTTSTFMCAYLRRDAKTPV